MSYKCLICEENSKKYNSLYPDGIKYNTVQQAHDHNKNAHRGKAKFKPVD